MDRRQTIEFLVDDSIYNVIKSCAKENHSDFRIFVHLEKISRLLCVILTLNVQIYFGELIYPSKRLKLIKAQTKRARTQLSLCKKIV
jgi:hypothetical protein